MIKGTNKGSITAEDGKFQIRNIKEGTYTLVATYVGLQAQEKEVTVVAGRNQFEIDFILPHSSQQLSEVMVTETRSINKKPVTVGKIAINPLDMPQSMAIIEQRSNC